jgi:hypothetical protein
MLRELYERRAMSVQQVADLTGLHKRGVYRRLVDYGIPTRPSGLRGTVPYARPAEVLTPRHCTSGRRLTASSSVRSPGEPGSTRRR